ncbi:MAG TPA: hypothetical protein VF553_03630 [Pyrinomonadaceae bacterium]|jgi:hypothetical protein
MFHIKKDYPIFNWPGLALLAVALVWISTGASVSAQTRTTRATTAAATHTADQPSGEAEPLFNEYKGIRIGMMSEEARKKLGSPQDKSDEQDFFVFNDKESAQVFYKDHKIYAISINYIGAGSSTPMPKAVLGSEIEAKPDGSMYKMVRYRKAGYWVSYSRTAGNDPLVTITMQRID